MYRLSFTAGVLLHEEGRLLAELYLSNGSWLETIETAKRDNTLGQRSVGSSLRLVQEAKDRLLTLNETGLRLVAFGSQTDRGLVMWYATCLRYKLIYEFAQEVIKAKGIGLQPFLEKTDIELFFLQKELIIEELGAISPVTKGKLVQVLGKMLKEASLVNEDSSVSWKIVSTELQEFNASVHGDFANVVLARNL
jgi:hypothetical protein